TCLTSKETSTKPALEASPSSMRRTKPSLSGCSDASGGSNKSRKTDRGTLICFPFTVILTFDTTLTSFAPGIYSDGNKTCDEVMIVVRIVTCTCERLSLALTIVIPLGDMVALSYAE